ncbi:unnamed protein product [Ambrosiozyma monospora]|uniref:Unnamed protein product n=1 Tax=Ambrosiozyma monospora TaxID=43982 RepID=A0A9W6WJH1_AMBMO|nr:unnamed protein product [Ambrosiozyma monospora]
MKATRASSMFSNFNETLNGMDCIKSFGLESVNRFKQKNMKLIDEWTVVTNLSVSNQRWLAIYLTMIGVAIMFLISMLCVFNIFDIGAASTGVLLASVLADINTLGFVIRCYTNVEGKLTSAERLVDYAYNLPQEPITGETIGPDIEWPTNAQIEYRDVSMRYRSELPLVLKHCTLSIAGESRLGICGRTGAGKSTILSTLYRLNELDCGSILIDGVDISTLNLKFLRSKLSIIPQDPVLFKGSIRDNLDPFHENSDDSLWDALRKSGLIEAEALTDIKLQQDQETMHQFHLDQEVKDDGENFSLGERQLIALARALVKKAKILIMDEATSSVDYETDHKIQTTIENEFNFGFG